MESESAAGVEGPTRSGDGTHEYVCVLVAAANMEAGTINELSHLLLQVFEGMVLKRLTTRAAYPGKPVTSNS